MELLIKKLFEKKIITQEKADKILEFEAIKPLSVYWELRTLLFLGISFLSTGLGILIYQNIDTIGHGVLIALIAIFCGYSFWYAYKNRQSFTWEKILNPNPFSNFALLGACILFLILEGYLQIQYNVFGASYNLATFIPAIIFVFLAYLFDHQGVLSMGITSLASWLGITVSPKNIFSTFELTNNPLIYTGISFGLVLIALGWFAEWKSLKKHFCFTYYFFGANLSFVALLTALFTLEFKLVFFLIILGLSTLCIFHARQTKSFMLLFLGVIYGYVGCTYFVFHKLSDDWAFTFAYLYFSISCGAIVYFLFNVRKILRIKKDMSQ